MMVLIPNSSRKTLCSCLVVLLIISCKTYGSSVTGDKRKLDAHEDGVDDHDHEEADIEPDVGLTRAPGIPPTFSPEPNQFMNQFNSMRGTSEYQERPPTMYPTGTDPYKNNHYARMEPDLYFHYPPPIKYPDLPPTPYPIYVKPPTMYPTAGKPTPFPTNRMETPQPTPLPTPYPTTHPTPYRKFCLLLLLLHLNGSYGTEPSNSNKCVCKLNILLSYLVLSYLLSLFFSSTYLATPYPTFPEPNIGQYPVPFPTPYPDKYASGGQRNVPYPNKHLHKDPYYGPFTHTHPEPPPLATHNHNAGTNYDPYSSNPYPKPPPVVYYPPKVKVTEEPTTISPTTVPTTVSPTEDPTAEATTISPTVAETTIAPTDELTEDPSEELIDVIEEIDEEEVVDIIEEINEEIDEEIEEEIEEIEEVEEIEEEIEEIEEEIEEEIDEEIVEEIEEEIEEEIDDGTFISIRFV